VRELLGIAALAQAEEQEHTMWEESLTPEWPAPMAPEAFHGLPGEFVRLVDPHTEADPAGLLVQFLVAVGSVIGRRPYFVAEADKHHLNLFAAMVGASAKGRKGTSWGHIRNALADVDETWPERVVHGLSSGEGLIWAVRDPITQRQPVKEKGRVTDYEDVLVDPGVEDKRLLVVEGEFATALRVLGREGNILSAAVRNAWDTGDLRTLTKNSPAKATGAHISIIGHVTRDELLRYLGTTEAANGFANRFLWVCVRRSKVLPDGGRLHEVDMAPFVRRLRAAVEFARSVGELRRDEEARAIWHEVYPELSEGKPGLLGAVIARAEAQVMRLACLYAVLDMSTVVRREHLLAALAVWDYCEASARFIFGDALGDPVADEILRALRQAGEEGMTRTAIRENLFQRNMPARRIQRALSVLVEAGLVSVERVTDTGGRPAEIFRAIVRHKRH
jgi:DNA-binding transcriptional ArsR family regulator